MAEILAFIAALPKLWDLYRVLVSQFGTDWTQVMNDIHAASAKLQNAKTDKERDDALSAIASAVYKR